MTGSNFSCNYNWNMTNGTNSSMSYNWNTMNGTNSTWNMECSNSSWTATDWEMNEAKETLDHLQDLLMAESVSIAAFNMTVYKIRANLSAVDLQAEDLEHCVQDLANNVENASSLLTPIFDAVEDMEAAAECGFVGDGYKDTKAVMCHAVLGSLSRIVVAMIVIAVLTMAGCMWTIGLVRKVDHWQEQKKQEKDEKLQQS